MPLRFQKRIRLAKGVSLKPVAVEEDLPYGTLKSFTPDLEVLKLQ